MIVQGATQISTIIQHSLVTQVFDNIILSVIPSLSVNLGGLKIMSGHKTSTYISWSCRLDSVEVIDF